MTRLEGEEAIAVAKATGATLNRLATDSAPAAEGLTPEEASAEDPSLIWAELPVAPAPAAVSGGPQPYRWSPLSRSEITDYAGRKWEATTTEAGYPPGHANHTTYRRK